MRNSSRLRGKRLLPRERARCRGGPGSAYREDEAVQKEGGKTEKSHHGAILEKGKLAGKREQSPNGAYDPGGGKGLCRKGGSEGHPKGKGTPFLPRKARRHRKETSGQPPCLLVCKKLW